MKIKKYKAKKILLEVIDSTIKSCPVMFFKSSFTLYYFSALTFSRLITV